MRLIDRVVMDVDAVVVVGSVVGVMVVVDGGGELWLVVCCWAVCCSWLVVSRVLCVSVFV